MTDDVLEAPASDMAGVLVHELELGNRVVAVYPTMNEARQAFDSVCRSDLLGVDGFTARKGNGRLEVRLGEGRILFASERGQLRGFACDTFYLDPGATYHDWMAPLIAMAAAFIRAGVEP